MFLNEQFPNSPQSTRVAKISAMPYKLAFMTVGILRKPVGHSQVQGFVDRLPSVYEAADSSDGFHGRSIRDVETWLHSWGTGRAPFLFSQSSKRDVHCDDSQPLEGPGIGCGFHLPRSHGEALTKRREWFEKHKLPGYVAWWVPADRQIDWKEGNARLEHLHLHGPTLVGFDFTHPFDPEGNATKLDREAVSAKAAMNAKLQTS